MFLFFILPRIHLTEYEYSQTLDPSWGHPSYIHELKESLHWKEAHRSSESLKNTCFTSAGFPWKARKILYKVRRDHGMVVQRNARMALVAHSGYVLPLLRQVLLP